MSLLIEIGNNRGEIKRNGKAYEDFEIWDAVSQFFNYKLLEKIDPCPFCEGEAKIHLCSLQPSYYQDIGYEPAIKVQCEECGANLFDDCAKITADGIGELNQEELDCVRNLVKKWNYRQMYEIEMEI